MQVDTHSDSAGDARGTAECGTRAAAYDISQQRSRKSERDQKAAATALGRYRAPATPADMTAPSWQRPGVSGEGGAQAPPSGPQRHVAPLPAPNLAAAVPRVRSGGGELDFTDASRFPPTHEADSKPVDGLPPEVLEVIAVAAEIALQHCHVRHAA